MDGPVCPTALNDAQLVALERFRCALDGGAMKLIPVNRCLCGGEESLKFAAMDRWGLPFASRLCLRCGLVCCDPAIAEESLGTFYGEFYDDLSFGRRQSADGALCSEGQGAKVFALLRSRLTRTRLRVLDIGAGMGSVMKEFAMAAAAERFAVSGLGVGMSAGYVSQFEAGGMDIEARQGGLAAVRESDGPFDVILMSHVFEHFAAPHRELARVKAFCREDSLVYVEVPGILDLRGRLAYESDWLKYCTCAHPYAFSLISLANVFNLNGFALLWGNEVVESIFVLGEQSVDITGNAERVAAYLDDLESSREFYSGLQHDRQETRREIRRLSLETEQLRREAEQLRREAKQLRGEVTRLADYIKHLRSSPPFRLYRWLGRMLRRPGASGGTEDL
jgi:SAM-dependent methyltransferase